MSPLTCNHTIPTTYQSLLGKEAAPSIKTKELLMFNHKLLNPTAAAMLHSVKSNFYFIKKFGKSVKNILKNLFWAINVPLYIWGKTASANKAFFFSTKKQPLATFYFLFCLTLIFFMFLSQTIEKPSITCLALGANGLHICKFSIW